jgi:general secretion pathway protein K
MALWALAILAVIATAVAVTTSTSTILARNHRETTQLEEIADAAIRIAVLRLLSPVGGVHPLTDATPFRLVFEGYDVTVTVQDESGKVDLNQATPELLLRVLVGAGLGLDDAQGVADKILDWREAGAGKRLNGAKADDYRAAGFAYGPRTGPFTNIEELRLVMGVTYSLYERIAPSLTVYSQTSYINADVAPESVLRILPGFDDERIEQMMQARADRADQSGTSPSDSASSGSVTQGHAFSIAAEVRGVDSARIRRTAVVRLTGFRAAPYWTYRWGGS